MPSSRLTSAVAAITSAYRPRVPHAASLCPRSMLKLGVVNLRGVPDRGAACTAPTYASNAAAGSAPAGAGTAR